ncbi:hypothetical protein C9374_011686 [Naegleria lovaniensis]|uniref:L,D-TPase catalytic domain-containing protein n=1 Tax=Naegleria lovaniensis TaxID=51637 RepID=A0AA88GGS1_NAELO|nr:uncharacterized protein C9374_011686 [Naegleria lovaniensis]KAG2373801.1 hypothetical protein C9374_011686 [Naegleria lovaniensis]
MTIDPQIRIRPYSPLKPQQGILTFNNKEYTCHVGRNGIGHKIMEGDGITPVGDFCIRMGFYRPDKVKCLHLSNNNNYDDNNKVREKAHTHENSSLISKITGIPMIEMKQEYGWCDDMFDEIHYNRLVRLPIPSSHEKLWRDDDLYDIVLVLGYNDNPIILGKGSAIFMHITNNGPTSGCIALAREDLYEILTQITPYTTIHISIE